MLRVRSIAGSRPLDQFVSNTVLRQIARRTTPVGTSYPSVTYPKCGTPAPRVWDMTRVAIDIDLEQPVVLAVQVLPLLPQGLYALAFVPDVGHNELNDSAHEELGSRDGDRRLVCCYVKRDAYQARAA